MPIGPDDGQRAALELVGHCPFAAVDIEQRPLAGGDHRLVREHRRGGHQIGDVHDRALLDEVPQHRGIAIDEVVLLTARQRREQHIVVVGLGLDHLDIETEMRLEFLDEQFLLGRVLAADDGGQDAHILRESGGGEHHRRERGKTGYENRLHMDLPQLLSSGRAGIPSLVGYPRIMTPC